MKVRPFRGLVEERPAGLRLQALARTMLGEEEVTVEVLSPPNAIGICRIRYLNQTLSRHFARLTAPNEAAQHLLDQADRFVQRDARQAENVQEPARPQIQGWTLDHVEHLRELLIDELAEQQFILSGMQHWDRRRSGARARLTHLTGALRYVNQWLKQERIRSTAARAGFSEEQRRDPAVLLSRLREIAYRLHRQIGAAGMPGLTDDEKAALDAAGYYLAHFADARKGPKSAR